MGDSAIPSAEQVALLRQSVYGEQGAGRARGTSPRPAETREIRAEPRRDDSSEIRDRVTISAEAYAKTATRYETYDRHGNLSFIVQPLVAKGSDARAQAIRDQVTLVLEPPPGAVRRGGRAEPAEILVWFSPNPDPEPA